MPGKEMERDQPKTLKTSADNGVTDAKGLPTGTPPASFRRGNRIWEVTALGFTVILDAVPFPPVQGPQ